MARLNVEVVARRWEHGWELHVSDARGPLVVLPTRRLSAAERTVRDFMVEHDGVSPRSVRVRITVTFDDGLGSGVESGRESGRESGYESGHESAVESGLGSGIGSGIESGRGATRGAGLDAEIAAVRAAVDHAERAQRDAAARSRALALRLRDAGLTGADIAVVLRVSPQRVSQLMRATGC